MSEEAIKKIDTAIQRLEEAQEHLREMFKQLQDNPRMTATEAMMNSIHERALDHMASKAKR